MYTDCPVRHAHFLCVTYRTSRTRMAQSVCKVHVAHLRLAFSTLMFSSAVLAVPARSLRHHVPVSTVFVVALPDLQKRGSSALPHEHRGVWLPGRSHALHTTQPPTDTIPQSSNQNVCVMIFPCPNRLGFPIMNVECS